MDINFHGIQYFVDLLSSPKNRLSFPNHKKVIPQNVLPLTVTDLLCSMKNWCVYNTVIVERFTGLNFCFSRFPRVLQRFSLNIYLCMQASYNGGFKCQAPPKL